MGEGVKTEVSPDGDGVKKTLDITIDGKKTTILEGTTLFDAVKGVGIELPAMCYHYAFSPFGSCGVCLVEVEGKSNNVRACTAKTTPNMVVRTDTPKMIEARKKAVEKWLVIHPLDCPVCDADGKCELQDMAYDLGVYDIKKGVRKEVPEDVRSVGLDFNMERCILCGQCINVCKEVQEIDALCFYKKDGKTLVGAHGGGTLFCEFCGDCLAVCPVGAIVSRFSKYAFKPWQLKKTETTCGYCSDGCTLTLESEGQKVVRVTSKLSYLSKFGWGVEPGDDHGGICVRGRFGFNYVQSERRLSRPMAKIDGRLTEIPWFKAIPLIGRRFSEIKAKHGGGAIAGLISGRCTNEEVYLFQRFMRVVLGTNQIDTAARYGHMNSVLAMQHALGIGRSTTSFKKMTLSDTIFIIGSNITETHPTASLRLKEAKNKFGAKIIVADTYQTNMRRLSTHPLSLALGGEAALICGLTKAVLQKGLADPSFIQNYPSAYEAICKGVADFSEEALAQKSGVVWDKISEAAELLAKSKRGTMIWGEGIVSRKGGYENVLRLIDLAMVTGLIERGGIHPICEENNEQGAVDMGGVPEFLPGQVAYTSPSGRARFEAAWNISLPEGVGATLPEVIERALRGEIKALYVVGENPLGSLPASMKVREALEKIDFIVCQDPFLTETGKMAHVVLPAVTFVEKEGTFTNMEGRVKNVAQAFDPREEARPDSKIFMELAKQMGHPLCYRGPEEIREEIATLVPDYFEEGGPSIQKDRYLSAEFVGEMPKRYSGVLSSDGSGGLYFLALTQIIYHSGKMSTQDSNLMGIYGDPLLRIGNTDAELLGIKTGDRVRVQSPLGDVEVPVEIRPDLPAGLIQFPEHFNEPAVKDLIEGEVDPVTKVPYIKGGAVSVDKVLRFGLDMVSSSPHTEMEEVH